MSAQCTKCDLYFDEISGKDWHSHYLIENRDIIVYEIVYNGKTHYTNQKGFCFDCLKQNDLLQKCCVCNKIMDTDTKLNTETMEILSKEIHGSNMDKAYDPIGSVAINIIHDYDNKITYVLDKKAKHGYYCFDCIETVDHAKFSDDPYSFGWEITKDVLQFIKPLGYYLRNNEEMLQTKKSLGKENGRYVLKTETKNYSRYTPNNILRKKNKSIKQKNWELEDRHDYISIISCIKK